MLIEFVNFALSDIEKMVSLKGMVIRCSSIIPEIREAVFRCLVCGHFSDPIVVDRGKLQTLISYIITIAYTSQYGCFTT